MKHTAGQLASTVAPVAPRRGAWIETALLIFTATALFVAPRRGAWIETGSAE